MKTIQEQAQEHVIYQSVDGDQMVQGTEKNVLDKYIELDKQIKVLEKEKNSIKPSVLAYLEENKTYSNAEHTMTLSISVVKEWTFDTIFKLFDGSLISKIMKPSTGQVNKFAELLSEQGLKELENAAKKKTISKILIK
jgi:hypothetical protein